MRRLLEWLALCAILFMPHNYKHKVVSLATARALPERIFKGQVCRIKCHPINIPEGAVLPALHLGSYDEDDAPIPPGPCNFNLVQPIDEVWLTNVAIAGATLELTFDEPGAGYEITPASVAVLTVDPDVARLSVAQTWTAKQSFGVGIDVSDGSAADPEGVSFIGEPLLGIYRPFASGLGIAQGGVGRIVADFSAVPFALRPFAGQLVDLGLVGATWQTGRFGVSVTINDPGGSEALRVGGFGRFSGGLTLDSASDIAMSLFESGAPRGTIRTLGVNKDLFVGAYNGRDLLLGQDAATAETIRARLTAAAFSPNTAGLLTHGTAALPWGPGFFRGDGETIRLARTLSTGDPFIAWFNELGSRLGFVQYDSDVGLLVSDESVSQFSIYTGGLQRARFTSTAFQPGTAGGITIGTASLPFGDVRSNAKVSAPRHGNIANADAIIITNDVDRWNFQAAGHLVPATNNVYDIGITTPLKPRDVYAARQFLGITGGGPTAPPYSFDGDADTGVYESAANQVSVAVGANEGARIVSGVLTDETALFLRFNRGAGAVIERVTLGAADSGGTGKRALVVPN